jgi:hypothetical protein
MKICVLTFMLAVSGCAGYSYPTDVMFGYWSAPR